MTFAPPTRQILLVEDNPGDADLIVDMLDEPGVDHVLHVTTLADACARIHDFDVDAVLLDLRLPDGSGVECVHALRAEADDVPIVVLSGIDDEGLALSCINAGAQDYLSKADVRTTHLRRSIGYAIARSEERRLRNQLAVSDRMVSIGTLAAGVAHELNNPLAAVLMNLDLAASEVDDLVASGRVPDVLVEELRDARDGAGRMRQIVRDLSVFARPDNESHGPVDVRAVIDSTLRLASNEIRHRARLVTDLGDVPLVDVNAARLGQVLLNVVVNAAQAIEVGDAEHNEIAVSARVDAEGFVVIAIRDTGAGMSVAVQRRLFTAFFTTKPVGAGTGLGLAMSQRLVTAMGGQLTFHTEVGKGTTFFVTLPVATSALTPAAEVEARHTGERGQVLVVDDEASLGRAIVRLLADHDVVAVTSADVGLSLIEKGRFDVVLCDVMMPQVTGAEFYARLKQLKPELARRTVFMTGGAFTDDARAFLDSIDNPRLEKPFDLPTLLSVVADLVAAAHDDGARRS